MNKTKKNGFLKIAGIMAAVMMMTTCVVAGTMAKYTSGGNVSGGSLDVASWNITVGGKQLTTANTSGLEDLSWNIQNIASESSAVDAVTANKMAPGTWGYAKVTVANAGDVDATLKVTNFTAPSVTSSTNVHFKLVVMESDTAQSTYALMQNVADGEKITTDGYTLAKSKSITIFICYEWV